MIENKNIYTQRTKNPYFFSSFLCIVTYSNVHRDFHQWKKKFPPNHRIFPERQIGEILFFFYPRSMINDDGTYCAGDRGAPGGFPGLPGHEQVHVLPDQELQPHQPGVPHTECLTQAIIAYHLYILSFMRKIYISLLL